MAKIDKRHRKQLAAFYGMFPTNQFPAHLVELGECYARRMGYDIMGFYVDHPIRMHKGHLLMTRAGFNECLRKKNIKPDIIFVVQDHIITDDTVFAFDFEDARRVSCVREAGIEIRLNFHFEWMPRPITAKDIPWGYEWRRENDGATLKGLIFSRAIRAVFMMWLGGFDIAAIRKMLKQYKIRRSNDQILTMLRDPFYSGYCVLRGKYGFHDPVVSPDEFTQSLERLDHCGII